MTFCSQVPLLFTTGQRGPQDWNFTTPENRACKAKKGGRCNCPRGKMISGSSGLNLMYYIRGAVKRVFERWVNEFNCTDWTLDDVNPYFMKSEDNDVNWNNPTHHSYGCDNLLAVSVPVVPDNIGFFETAGAQLNPPIPKVADINGGYEDECFCTVQTTTRNGRRWSAAKAFLKQIKYFLNYRLIQNGLVTKILFRGTKAYGVEFYVDGQKYTATATKKIICCGGAILTPVLLLQSGVGPKNVLDANKIPVVYDLPYVGKGLIDHYAIWMFYQFTNIKDLTTNADLVTGILQYNQPTRTGFYAGTGTLPLQKSHLMNQHSITTMYASKLIIL